MISIPHLTLSIISMLSIGVANLLMRFPSRRYGTRRTLVYRGLCMSALLGLGAVLTNAWVFDLKMIIFTLLLSFLGYLPLAAFVKGLSVGKVGVVTPIANSSVIVTVLFSLVFFGEVLTPGQYGGIGLIVLGIVLISINFQDLKQSDLLDPSSGIGYALIALVIWGIFFPLLKIPSSQLGPFMTTFLIEIGILAWAFLHLRLHGTSSIIQRYSARKAWIFILLLSVLSAVHFIAFTTGISRFGVSIVMAITYSNPIIVAIAGRFILKQHLSTRQWISIGSMLMGILVISLA